MTAHLIQRKGLDMADFADDAGERRGDHRTRQHRREQRGKQRADGKTDDEPPQRGFDRTKEFSLGNHGRERPAGKWQRRQRDLIGRAIEGEPPPPGFLAALVAGLRQRHPRQRQHRRLAVRGMQLVGVLVGRCDQFAAAVEDEGRSGASDLELREETRKPRVFDDDGKDALTLLVDVDRSGKGDRRTLADRMVEDPEPLRTLRRPCRS